MKKLLILLAVFAFIGCEPANDNTGNSNEGITGNRIHEHVDGWCVRFIDFEYKGHSYIYTTEGYMFHAPHCKCFESKQEFDSFDSFSNSLFDW